ncbi:MAG: hypothetical protein H7287_13095 [Thermoleophilia bacterium]|nr:hypothetical protein [Thermoleophilia bacterium]
MQIQPAFNAGANQGTTSTSSIDGGGLGSSTLEGLRADWNVRMNVSHDTGFVGGAGRLLIHNLVVEEKREITLLLPAALQNRPGQLQLESAAICSAKPGIAAAPGQPLAFRAEGAKVVVTIPVLNLNDWVYIDFTWTGGFAKGGTSFPQARVPLGDFHPQIAVPVTTDNGQAALAPVTARYDVELGTDLGATVQLDGAAGPDLAGIARQPSADGAMTMHEFKSYGTPRIDAVVIPGMATVDMSRAVVTDSV